MHEEIFLTGNSNLNNRKLSEDKTCDRTYTHNMGERVLKLDLRETLMKNYQKKYLLQKRNVI